MATIKNIIEGQILWDYHKYRTNGGTSKMGCWPVEVVSIDIANGKVMCKWNGNPQLTNYTERRLSRLKVRKRKESC